MAVPALVNELRDTVPTAVWSAAVQLARDGAVAGIRSEDDEIELRVRTHGRPTPFEVFLWPADLDTGCDCSLPAPCVHVCAATIAVNKGLKMGRALPEAAPKYKVKLRYDFTRAGPRLEVVRTILWPDGRTEALKGPLVKANMMASRGDTQAEGLLVQHSGGSLDEERLRRLLVFLEGKPPATLNGKKIALSAKPIPFEVHVKDEGDLAFRVGLYRPAGLDELFLGAALQKGRLHPTTYGNLPEVERRALHPRRADRVFGRDQVGWLVSDYLPRLRDYDLPVIVDTDRLPHTEALKPRVVVEMGNVADGLKVRADVVYGDPPIARVSGDGVVKLGDVVPVRDHAAEKRVAAAFTDRTRDAVGVHVPVGFDKILRPEEAAKFLARDMGRLGVQVTGRVDVDRFRIAEQPLSAVLDVGQETDGFSLGVRFEGTGMSADPAEVLRAWQRGRSLVPLLEGGYAPLPADWLHEHGGLLLELWEARDPDGRVGRNATAALVELLEDTDVDVPPDLHKLRTFLEGGEGLPEAELPPGFVGELRPYQEVGYRWLRFLRDMDLHGVLADDMGLGKTVQTLAVLGDTPGRHLVVAPTSVIRNWEREAQRFVPNESVSVYHGPTRVLDPNCRLVLTSYALLRLDRAKLMELKWSYLVLDESQAIKNPDSQTARAAFRMPSDHRLALSGTPVENRLEELWSLFRFLMPGLLGTPSSFRERFVKPIEMGDATARKALQSRVRPYVLRRHKRQVARDLPPLTEMVVRCELGPEQRKIYDALRMSARAEVAEMFSRGDGRGGWQMQVLEALLRMRQACCDPVLVPGIAEGRAGSAKLDRLEEMLVELVSDGHKSLVFSQFTSLLDRVEPRLDALGIDYVRLDGSTRDRQKVIDAFQDEDGPPVFLLSLKAGGTGLNLTAADYVIHLDPWWNPAVEQQATDRAHRIGQHRPVVSCRLIAENTVEERILQLQDAKRDLVDAALGREGGMLRALSSDELRSLFDAG